MRATIKDIANLAGVSGSTVSRALSDDSRISKKTKEKIQKIAKELNYKPNIMARGLVSKRKGILGVVLPKATMELFTSQFFIEIMQGISKRAKENNYYIMFDFCKSDREEFMSTKKFVESGLVDGICLLSSRDKDESLEFLKDKNFPFVVIGEPLEKTNTLWVDNNNLEATYNLVKEYKKEKNLIFIGGNKHLTVTKNRVDGFKKACLEFEIDGKILLGRKFSMDEGYRLAGDIEMNEKLEKIIISDDQLLMGVLDYFEENKIFNVEIVSFNRCNVKELWKNKVRTIDIQPSKLGSEAINLLLYGINNNINEKNKMINIEF
ncbi:LacI family DNA-binding transcriptional regulator [Fusobacterium sp. MFO224]|uniref:LacI family DNA-binding transcriptional regulator n=1 Tax=Fusobacterium sp. MFO224 TaxID=3378070 RepID=UPI0038522ACB